jgi:3-hydroxyisobutyrate dehydrogenase-like beta-hydroxyacid dehydrogenase
MTVVAFLGLGRMGRPMAVNVRKAGFDLVVWNRTAEKATEFAASHGATAAASPAEAAAAADVVISMLADDAAVIDAHAGEHGTFSALRTGAVAVDMSTVALDTVRELAKRANERRTAFLDAPVSGSVKAAADATLTIMAAGPAAAVDLVRPVLGSMGDPVVHMGESGMGAAMKLSVNAVVHALNGALSEALVLAERSGIDRRAAYEVYLNSAIAAPFVHYRQAAFEQPGEVPVAFRLALAGKDLRNALQLAAGVGADLPHTAAALEVLERAAAAGFGEDDESAVAQYLRTTNGS